MLENDDGTNYMNNNTSVVKVIKTFIVIICDLFLDTSCGPKCVAGGEDGLQIWRVATNILNKQSPTADKG
jgi:hypothetical protein